jgi:uncharacterized protein YlzI (FlbEa/FlbD family)
MIRLTYISGKAISVSPELIKAVIEDENFTHILFGPDDDYIKVSETREEVARRVLEWRLAMERYRAYTYSAACEDTPQANEIWPLAHNIESKLMRLAGMEEPNHDT